MTPSQYLVKFLEERGVFDVFYYPGGMVTYLQDAFSKSNVNQHLCYNEQGASFAANGWAMTRLKSGFNAENSVGVAYATSGPGVTNLISGIANAYYDNIPTLFILGQVNTYEQKAELGLMVKQSGFQEMPALNMVSEITKYSVSVKSADEFVKELEKSWEIATTGRMDSVAIELPMNVSREEIKGL